MSEIRLLRQHIVKLQEEITKVKKSPTYVISFVTNDTIPQQLQRNTVYYNLSNDEILVWNDFTNEWFMLSGGGSGGLSFEELSSMIIAGEGITLSVDSEQQTITFNNDFEGMTMRLRNEDGSKEWILVGGDDVIIPNINIDIKNKLTGDPVTLEDEEGNAIEDYPAAKDLEGFVLAGSPVDVHNSNNQFQHTIPANTPSWEIPDTELLIRDKNTGVLLALLDENDNPVTGVPSVTGGDYKVDRFEVWSPEATVLYIDLSLGEPHDRFIIPFVGTQSNVKITSSDGHYIEPTGTGALELTFSQPLGQHWIAIEPKFQGNAFDINFFNAVDKLKLTHVHFGSNQHSQIGSTSDNTGMFYGCTNLKDISGTLKKTVNATTMRAMFNGCSSFNPTTFDIDTSSVTDMRAMFKGCSSFTSSILFITTYDFLGLACSIGLGSTKTPSVIFLNAGNIHTAGVLSGNNPPFGRDYTTEIFLNNFKLTQSLTMYVNFTDGQKLYELLEGKMIEGAKIDDNGQWVKEEGATTWADGLDHTATATLTMSATQKTNLLSHLNTLGFATIQDYLNSKNSNWTIA